MTQFNYIGRDKTGKKQLGKITGGNRGEAILKLRENGIRVLEINAIPETVLSKEIYFGNPVKLTDFVMYIRQFATLLRAGVSIVESNRILGSQTTSKALKKALVSVEEDLRTGIPLSDACGKHSKIFPSMYVNMVRAGEAGGNLDETLDRLATYYEKQNQTKKKIQSALAYPVVIAILAFGVTIFLLTSVVPTFAQMFEDTGGELPAITQFVMGASEFVQGFWWLILLIIIGIIIVLTIFKQNPSSKYYLDYAILKMPIFGKLMQKALLARMTRTLSSLFSSSVPILQALSIVEKVIENGVMSRVLKGAKESLEKGESLTEPMKKHWVFPPLVTQMIAIGEETGALDGMLSKVADFYEMEVENTTDSLKSLIEPLMIVFLAGIVGVIVLSIMVPMFEIFNQVDKF